MKKGVYTSTHWLSPYPEYWCNILSTHLLFVLCQLALPFLIQHFQNLTLKIQGQCQMTMMLHNHRSRPFHRTSNGINPSSGFRDMGSAKSGSSAAWFDKFLAHGQAQMGQMGKRPWQCTTTGLDNSTENFKWSKYIKRLQRYGFCKSGSSPPDCLHPHLPGPWWQYPSSPEDWG